MGKLATDRRLRNLKNSVNLLVVFIMVLAIGAGVVLIRQNQDPRSRANEDELAACLGLTGSLSPTVPGGSKNVKPHEPMSFTTTGRGTGVYDVEVCFRGMCDEDEGCPAPNQGWHCLRDAPPLTPPNRYIYQSINTEQAACPVQHNPPKSDFNITYGEFTFENVVQALTTDLNNSGSCNLPLHEDADTIRDKGIQWGVNVVEPIGVCYSTETYVYADPDLGSTTCFVQPSCLGQLQCIAPSIPNAAQMQSVTPGCVDEGQSYNAELSWLPVEGATTYKLTVSGTEHILNSSDVCDDDEAICEFDHVGTGPGTYNWGVQSGNVCRYSTPATRNIVVPSCDAETLPWFQAEGASVFSSNKISDKVPEISGLYLINQDSQSNSVGAAIYGDFIDYVAINNISIEKWNAQSPMHFNAGQYDFDYFNGRVPSIVSSNANYKITGSSIKPSQLQNGGAQYGGYRWFKKTGGNLTIDDDNASLGITKVILLVEDDLIINRQLRYNSDGFFMAIVGGNITINEDLPSPDDDNLQGFYFTDMKFQTQSDGDDPQLIVTGAVSTKEGFDLGRTLPNNDVTPAERFVFAPEDVFKFPWVFSKRNLIWREVTP